MAIPEATRNGYCREEGRGPFRRAIDLDALDSVVRPFKKIILCQHGSSSRDGGRKGGLRFRTPSILPLSPLYCRGESWPAGGDAFAGAIGLGRLWTIPGGVVDTVGASLVCACRVSLEKASSIASEVIFPMSVLL